jgi:hypothetical protein
MTPPPSNHGPAPALSLKDVVRFIVSWLTQAARTRAWGELRITVQAGQIVFIHESHSHRDRLPSLDTDLPAGTAARPGSI